MVNLLPFKTKGRTDPLDFADTVNVFFLGPNAAVKEKNRKQAQKEFQEQLRSFNFGK